MSQNCQIHLISSIIYHDDLLPNIKDKELIIHENVIYVDTHKNSIDACSAIMLYNLKSCQKFNLAYYIAHKIEDVKNRDDCPLPYGLLLSRLYRHILAKYPKLFRSHSELQFVLHFYVMNSINTKTKRGKVMEKQAKAQLPGSPSSDAKGHKVIQSRYATFNEDPLYRDKAATYFSNLTAQKQNDQVALEDCPDNLEENNKIAEHGLSSENTQSSGGSLDMSEGYESSGSSHSIRRSNNEDKDIDVVKAIFVTLQQVQRSNRESRALHRGHGSDMAEINMLKRQFSQKFEIKDLGSTKQILGISIIRVRTVGTLRLSYEKHIGKVLEKFNMNDGEARFGNVIYAMVCTRLDIAHAVRFVSRFMSNPGREHWEAFKWMLRYLKRKSTTGYIFTVDGTTISWMSRIHKCVAISTIEAEIWLLQRLPKSCEGTLSLTKILRAENPADMFTKVVTIEKLKLYATSTRL
ncbi:retrovirus-related pol polyprotein from transposon TNT 1-94 [Tanacetum coccineum]